MYPEIRIGSVAAPTFSLFVAAGIALMIVSVVFALRKSDRMSDECYYIIPKLCIALGFAYLGAILLDALFKIPQNGGFKLSGMTFYGGLIVGGAVFYALVRFFRKNTSFSVAQWLETVTVPFILFHMFGRLGCFFGGCCYGRVTDSVFGLAFPDQPDKGIFHNGQKVYPTQLYEALLLGALALVLTFVKKRRFVSYVFAYPVLRFTVELLRGDNRGSYLLGLSPAQFISVIIVVSALGYIGVRAFLRRKRSIRRHGNN